VVVTSNAYTSARMDELRAAGATEIITKAKITPKEIARVIATMLNAAKHA
jgi:hypothetical protein